MIVIETNFIKDLELQSFFSPGLKRAVGIGEQLSAAQKMREILCHAALWNKPVQSV